MISRVQQSAYHQSINNQTISFLSLKVSSPELSSKAKEIKKDFNGNEPSCDLQNDLPEHAASSKMFDEQAASETLLLLSSARESQVQRYIKQSSIEKFLNLCIYQS